MSHHSFSFVLLFGSFLAVFVTSKEITDVTTIHMDFSTAFFPVRRAFVEEALRERIGRDDQCGPDVNLTIPDASTKYKGIAGPNQYVISAMFVKYTSPQLDEALCDDVGNEYATSYYAVMFRIPALINNRGPPSEVTLQLAYYTNSRKKIIDPFLHGDVQYIDDITVDGDQVTLTNDDDVMIMNIQHDLECPLQDKVAETDSRDIRDHSFSSFPAEIDWQFCERANWKPNMCQRLIGVKCDLTRYHGDYCVNFADDETKLCDNTMTITEASGIFRKMAFMEDMISVPPARGIWAEGLRTVSVQYPCLTH